VVTVLVRAESRFDVNPSELSPTLASHPTAIPPQEAAAFLRETFGISGTLQPLRSERDENFLVTAGADQFVLKFANPAEDPTVTLYQSQAMAQVARHTSLCVPSVVETRSGHAFGEYRDRDGRVRLVRLLTFLPGIMVAQVTPTPRLRREIGAALAQLDDALGLLAAPCPPQDLSWDMARAPRLRQLLAAVADRDNRLLAERALDAFETTIAPVYAGLRAQVIHNDLNPFNVLVDPDEHDRIVGILDFGDIIQAPLVQDLAIAASYHVGRGAEILRPIGEMLAGYVSVAPLTREELDLLPDLIAVRLAMTVIITEWRASQFPENRPYILKNHPAAVTGLKQLAALPRSEAQHLLAQYSTR
jgi:Ser/Thr protein kinase RdoA (MazF antagonist)